ncbi:MAG: MFS transporter [Gammaproteobacteria bacterium]|jgi:MFS family permease|nr:MFS transporter [Gammaproteobacteria bacterium]MDP6616651.1 MFS transporter [Gammaproteobacteria bacterium]MDP6694981.1 MFS transporter [Gammaproteobacteria bacterium]MDP7041331.1 MFS transporter [Gammaproteobacteria bacterium]
MASAIQNSNTYRWVIVACAFAVLFISQGMTLGGLQVFDEKLLAHLGAQTGTEISLGAFKGGLSIMFATAGVLGMLGGWLCDIVGAKKLLLSGLVLLAAGNFMYSDVNTLTDIYIVSALLGLVLVLCGLMINIYLVSGWFTKKRGLAIGIVLAGTSLGNAAFPKLNGYLMTLTEWQQVFNWIAWIPLAVIPLLMIFLKDSPSLESEADQGGQSELPPLSGYTLKEALLSLNFWALAAIAMCTFYSILAMSGHTYLFFRGEGYSEASAGTAVSIVFLGGLVGKVISGYLAESFGRKRVLLTGLVMMLGGIVTMVGAMLTKNALLVWGGLSLFGFGWGGIYTLIQVLAADLFGMLALGKILGAINVLDTFGGAMGPVLTGILVGTTGGYLQPFLVIAALLIIATIAACLLNMAKGVYHEFAPDAA